MLAEAPLPKVLHLGKVSLGKVPKDVGYFQSKKLYCKISFILRIYLRGIKSRLGLFRTFICFGEGMLPLLIPKYCKAIYLLRNVLVLWQRPIITQTLQRKQILGLTSRLKLEQQIHKRNVVDWNFILFLFLA